MAKRVAMMLKFLFWAWLLFTVIYGGFGIMLFLFQSKFLYCPVRKISYTPDDINLAYENVWFKAADQVKLNGWYIPSENAEFTVLFCHGNGGNIMHRLDTIFIFNNLGLNCFIFDYRGYGLSNGKTTEQGTYLDVMAAYNWLINEKGADPNRIIIFGRSLGGSVAAQLATKKPVASLVLESCFTSYVDMGKKFYWYMPVKWFARYKYRTIDYVKGVNIPVMVIHSPDDEIIPYEFGRQLYQAANEPKEFVEIAGGHNDGFLTSGRSYTDPWRKWLQFLQQQAEEMERSSA
ncbi:MAG: alpha/beta hydrolase [Sedimentisphaerales bacterium]|nr:alpha/beta hydrolase [Sedimentisphaerales bacterium]